MTSTLNNKDSDVVKALIPSTVPPETSYSGHNSLSGTWVYNKGPDHAQAVIYSSSPDTDAGKQSLAATYELSGW